jgi:hypothetical protein
MANLKYYIIIIALLVASVLIFVVSYRKGPIVQVKGDDVYDWGVVLEGASLSHDFVLKNIGDQVINVKRVKSSCGCVEVKLSRKSLLSGEEANVTVKYIGRPLTSKEVLQVWVETNDPKNPVTTLVMTGQVELQVFWHPRTVSFFCEQKDTADKSATVEVVTDFVDKFALEEVSTSSEKISVSTDKNSKGITCKVQPGPNCPKGNWVENFKLRLKIGDYIRDIEIPVYLMIQ